MSNPYAYTPNSGSQNSAQINNNNNAPPAQSALPIAETVTESFTHSQISVNQQSVVPETYMPETVIPETVLQSVPPRAGPSTNGAGPSRPVGDGTMDIDEAPSGPSTILEDITHGASKVLSPIIHSVQAAMGAAVQSTITDPSAPVAGPSRQPQANGDHPSTSTRPQPISTADLFARPSSPASNNFASSSARDSPRTSTREVSRIPSAMSGGVPIVASAPLPPPRPRTYRTGYIYDTNMMLHCIDGYQPTDEQDLEAVNTHPEEPMRIKRIFSRLKEAGLVGRMKELAFQQVSFEQVMLVHSEDHWAKVEGTQEMSDEIIQQTKQFYEQLSLYVCRETAHCARLSCGGVIQACISVCTGEVRNAFTIVRPPGHHAEPDEHMGFCFYNNVAVAAKEVQRLGLAKKVLILDWDVHHGNGTQRAFWEDENVLYISIHRHENGQFYPTSDFGGMDQCGSGPGAGTSVNIPWPGPGHGDADYLYAFQRIIMPIAYEFAPDLVIISAGFDAARGDILGGCDVTPPAYGHMTHMLCAVAGGKVVVALEGGYNLAAISDSSVAVAQVLLGETPAELPPMQASEVATEVMYEVAKVQSKYWKSIDVKACEPPPENTGDLKTVTTIPELLKIHRAHHMFTKHNLYQIPLASEELQKVFEGQVICSPTVYEAGEKSVLVVFVHDFGNLRVETSDAATTNIQVEKSYLLDTSDLIVNWVTESGYSIIDVNILTTLAELPPKSGKPVIARAMSQDARLMRYLWDNYIELSESENVVLIGHGSGCQAVVDLVNSRDIEHKVKAVVQVAGLNSLVRIDPDDNDKGAWFRESSKIFVPSSHPILENDRAYRRAGAQIIPTESATKVVDILNTVLPQIKEFVGEMITPIAPAEAEEEDVSMAGPSQAGPSNGPGTMNVDTAGLRVNGDGDVMIGDTRQTSIPPPIAA